MKNELTLKDIHPHLIYDFASEHELVQTIQELSQNFTTKREQLGQYLASDKMVAAYACFYLLTNIPKLQACLSYLKKDVDDFLNYEVFDIGAGPGTFSLAMLLQNPNLDIKGIETSTVMKKQGELLAKNLFRESKFEYIDSVTHIHKQKKRLGIFGHSANEMQEHQVLQYINNLELDEVIFIEPGTKEFFAKFINLRENLLKNFQIKYPCLSAHICPLGKGDWCHQYLSVSHNFEVERLTQLAKKDRRNLPIALSYFVRDELDNNQLENLGTIIRVYPPTKFSIEWQLCYFNGAENKVIDFQLMMRGYKKPEIKRLNNFMAGERIKFEIERELADNKVRGKLL